MKKVLITGMSGLIGGLLRRHLEGLGRYELSALNRRPIFFATSNNRWGYRDLEHTRQVLGYVPQDSAEAFR